MFRLEMLEALAHNPDAEGSSLDFQRFSGHLTHGFRMTNAGRGVSLGKIYVITRFDSDLFQIELDSTQVATPDLDNPYFKCRVDLTRSKAVWKQPGSAVLERWHVEFGSQIPTSKWHAPNLLYGGELNEEEFLRRFNQSAPDDKATAELKAYLEMCARTDRWPEVFNWVSEEQSKLTPGAKTVNPEQ